MKIVAPAGNMERFYAAVKGGAHEIYMGLKGFGARRNAENFTLSEYIEALNYAHLRGVRIFLTLNTIMRDSEIEAIYTNLKKLYEAGLDAVIVQDLGLFRFIKDNFPNIDLHGSTQMTVANHVEANYIKKIGFSRVVLSRELSFEEIEEIRGRTDIELEIFVSGALCVSYSGNCYLSSFIGGRSGNRGLCAQPCRKIYRDDKGKVEHTLSPKDQFLGLDEVQKLKKIGIESIKIEGRMKSPQYVYETVSYYDGLIEEIDSKPMSKEIFNRGYSKGFFYGADKRIMNTKYSSDLGRLIGQIKSGKVELLEDVVLGDGLSYVSRDYYKLGGEYLSKIVVDGSREKRKTARAGETIKLNRDKLPKGSLYLYKNYSKVAIDNADNSIKTTKRQLNIYGSFKALVGERAELKIWCENKRGSVIKIEKVSEGVIERASKRSATIEDVRKKLVESGDTTFRFNELSVELGGEEFIPASVLKGLRRDALEELKDRLLESYIREAKDEIKRTKSSLDTRKKASLLVSVSSEEQLNYVKELGIERVYIKQLQVAREGKLNEIDETKPLATTLYQGIKGGRILNWNLNISNTYALTEVSKIPSVDTVILSPEMNIETIKKIGRVEGIRKGLVIYGKLLGMYIEIPLSNEDKVIENEQGDRFILKKNRYSNTEVYLEKPMNLIKKLEEIEEAGIDDVVLEFTDETSEEIKAIIDSFKDGKSEFNPYNYIRGAY